MVKELIRSSGFQKFKGFVWSPESGAVITSAFLLFVLSLTLYLGSQRQDIRQQAAPGFKTATIAIEPTNNTFTLGQIFEARLVVNGGGQTFDGAHARVVASNNLFVEKMIITPPEAGGCNFNFSDRTTTPSASNLSFNGLLPNSTSSKCILYTLRVRTLRDGQAAITITGGQVMSTGTDQDNILKSTQNGIYTITP